MIYYLGYREELYSRLEIKRILEDRERPKRPRLKQKLPSAKQVKTFANCSLLNVFELFSSAFPAKHKQT